MRFRVFVRASASLLALIYMTLSAVPAAAAPLDMGSVGQLGVGDELFWEGEWVEDSLDPDGDCPPVLSRCFDYRFEVVEEGALLRVAVDDPSGHDQFSLQVFDPSGERVWIGGNLFTEEAHIEDPDLGTWTARVVPTLVSGSKFRMRAALQDAPKEQHGAIRDVLPNLRLTPPFEVTFSRPSNIAYPPDLDAVGRAGHSCHADEMVDDDPVRCLRFTLGPQNVGEGPLELVYRAMEGVTEDATLNQVVHRSDGTTYERPAGSFRWHATHAHYHHVGFGSLELFRVIDAKKGEYEPAGRGPKQGFCMLAYMIVDWTAFDQAPRTHNASCEPNGGAWELFNDGSRMWLESGWSDLYPWRLPGNYVDFGANPDGLYLIRSTADVHNDILESDESDNTGYAYIQVDAAGGNIEVLERGHGESPWDPRKIVVEDWLPENPETDWLPFVPLI